MFSMRGIETICGYGVECGGVYGADEWVGCKLTERHRDVCSYSSQLPGASLLTRLDSICCPEALSEQEQDEERSG
jgi:hypothetical protein